MSVIEREIHKGILEDKVRKYSGFQCFYDIPSHWKMPISRSNQTQMGGGGNDVLNCH